MAIHSSTRPTAPGGASESRQAAAILQAQHAISGPRQRRAAQVDIARLALVTLHRNAGQAADGLSDVLVGQAADGVGRDDADQRGRFALGAQRGFLRLANGARTRNDDFIFFGGSSGGDDRRCRLRKRRCAAQGEGGDAAEQGCPAAGCSVDAVECAHDLDAPELGVAGWRGCSANIVTVELQFFLRINDWQCWWEAVPVAPQVAGGRFADPRAAATTACARAMPSV
jgi:hypothetical protein